MVKDHSHNKRQRNGEHVLIEDAFNTFYLRLYGVGHMTKNHSDSRRGNWPPPYHGYSFWLGGGGWRGDYPLTVQACPPRDQTPATQSRDSGVLISSNIILYMHHPTDSRCYTSRAALVGTNGSWMNRRSIAPRRYVSLRHVWMHLNMLMDFAFSTTGVKLMFTKWMVMRKRLGSSLAETDSRQSTVLQVSIPPFKWGRKDISLFNDTLNTFYWRLYGVWHMVKDNSNSEKGRKYFI